jgi:ABC-type transport system substrate-binding protein
MNNKKVGLLTIGLCLVMVVASFSGCVTEEEELTKITLYYNVGNDARKLGCQLLKDNIEGITDQIKIEIQELEWPQYLDKLQNKEMPIFFLGWLPDYAHPDNYLDPFGRSSGTYAERVGFNDSQIDAWIDEAKQELDPDKAKDLYSKIENKLFDQAVYLYIDQPQNLQVERTWCEGFFYNPMYSNLVYKHFNKNGSDDDETYTHITIGGPRFLDPAWDYESAGGEILQNVYETLVFYKGTSAAELEPMLATEVPTVENGGISEDGLTYTFKLRENVTFHDGTKFNASAVKYSIDRALYYEDPESPGWILTQVLDKNNDSTVEVVDEYTVRLNLQFPYSPFIYCLAYTIADIVSPTYVEANGGIVPRSENTWMDRHTCGTGPYMVEEWAEDGSYLKMVKNSDYWGEEPSIDTIYIKYVSEYNTRLLALTGGEADSIYVPLEHADEVKGLDGVRVITDDTFQVSFFGFNQLMEPFDDLDMRKAFCYAFDYQIYIDEIRSGYSSQLQGIIPNGMFGHDDDLPMYSHDLVKAKEYLEAAGFTTR